MLWDATQSTLVVARDPFGVRPCITRARAGGPWRPATRNNSWRRAWLRLTRRHGGGRSPLLGVSPTPNVPSSGTSEGFPRATCWSQRRRASESPTTEGRDPETESGGRARVPGRVQAAVLRVVRRRLESTRAITDSSERRGRFDREHCVADQMRRGARLAAAASRQFPRSTRGCKSNEERYLRAVEAKVHLPVECWDGTAALPDELDAVVVWAPGGRVPWTGGSQGTWTIARQDGARVILNGSGGDQLGAPDGVHEDAILQRRWGDAARFMLKAPGANLPVVAGAATLRLAKALSPRWVRDVHDRLRWRRSPETRLDGRSGLAGMASQSHVVCWRRPALRSHVQRQRWSELTSGRYVFCDRMAAAVGHTRGRRASFPVHGLGSGRCLRFPFLRALAAALAVRAATSDVRSPICFPPLINQRRGKANATDAFANRVSRQLPTIRRLFDSPDWLAGRYVDQASAKEALAAFEASSPPAF